MLYAKKRFWLDAGERAIRTFAQATLAVVGIGTVGILSTDWVGALSVGGGAAAVSLLMSLGSAGLGDPGTASAVHLD